MGGRIRKTIPHVERRLDPAEVGMPRKPRAVGFAAAIGFALLLITSITAIGAAAQTVSFDVRVSSGDDDAEEFADGTMYLDSGDLELVDDGSRIGQTIGLRFAGVDIPPGSRSVLGGLRHRCRAERRGP